MSTRTAKRAVGFLVAGTLLVILSSGILTWQAGSADVENPRANFWRVVRDGVPGYTSVTTPGHHTLIVNSGENWREIRNGILIRFSPWLLIATLAVMGVFYWRVGPDRLEEHTGVKVRRYATWERVMHWYTAGLFVIMAVTGLLLLLGRVVLMPIVGHPVVSGALQASKALHNYCGPLLLVGFALIFVVWVRYNIPRKYDLDWFKGMGGLLRGPRPHIGRVNAGEKGWFWIVFLFGIIVGLTGIILDFPVWGQSRFTMQVSHLIHATVAVLFVTVSFGHIYMGTIGVEGAFVGMWTGYVDEGWARQHSDLWLEETMRAKGIKPATERSEET
ncbi:MAG TPA: formate dehydrogenase subunit gamma [Syntrophales bacterium]|nr:formate dehydrogenase subunit gamma [Syntrophales bacterium]